MTAPRDPAADRKYLDKWWPPLESWRSMNEPLKGLVDLGHHWIDRVEAEMARADEAEREVAALRAEKERLQRLLRHSDVARGAAP
mgnify:FL=1